MIFQPSFCPSLYRQHAETLFLKCAVCNSFYPLFKHTSASLVVTSLLLLPYLTDSGTLKWFTYMYK